MKKIKYLLLLTIVLPLVNSCKNDSEPAPAPTISSISPTKGTVSTEVTITGSNFATTASANTVKFNSVDAEIVSATPTQIVAKVPSGASAQFSRLQGIAINSKGEIFVGDRNNFVIRKIIFQ